MYFWFMLLLGLESALSTESTRVLAGPAAATDAELKTLRAKLAEKVELAQKALDLLEPLVESAVAINIGTSFFYQFSAHDPYLDGTERQNPLDRAALLSQMGLPARCQRDKLRVNNYSNNLRKNMKKTAACAMSAMDNTATAGVPYSLIAGFLVSRH